MNNKPVAVITGASRGIGRAVAIALASGGYDIAAIGRSVDSEGMENLAQEVEKTGAQFFPVGLDISCTECQIEVVANILERYGRMDFLVNNAGVAPLERSDVLNMTEESYDRVMNINLRGPLFFAQKVAKEMIWLKEQINDYKPVIVFITSVSSVLSSTNRSEYCVSKAGGKLLPLKRNLLYNLIKFFSYEQQTCSCNYRCQQRDRQGGCNCFSF